jgi:uncharacterized protein
MDTLIYALSFATLCFLIFGLLRRWDARLTLVGGLLFAAYLGLDDLLTGLPSASAAFRIVEGEWNWSGKFYSLLLGILVILALRLKPLAVGLTLRQRHLRTSLIALALFGLWGLMLGLLFSPPAPSAETLAFQALMPGVVEELAYRGIAPALLLGLIFGRGTVPEGIPWAVVLITALAFGLWHGLGYGTAGFTFDPLSALFPFIGSVAGGWLRFHSGSLLFPVLAHGLANTTFQLAGFVGG